MVEMEVVGVAPEPNSNRPLVWLKDKEQRVFLPIAIGNFEAAAIYMELYNDPPPRPITYDLLRSILNGLDALVERVVINALRDDTFYAEITLSVDGRTLEIDSRPSDAIALALRVDAPIFVEEPVVREAGLVVEKQSTAGGPGSTGEESAGAGEPAAGGMKDVASPVDIVDGVEQRVVTLKARLVAAVAQEEYEEAARIRDEIGKLQHERG